MYDILITNCRIIDGTGAPWYRADVAIKDGRIVKIGHLCGRPEHKAAETVDGQDRYLAPGFIDIHSHSDTTLMECSRGESRILQGVTTEIGGNCGISAAPASDDAERREELRGYVGDLSYDWRSVGEFLDMMDACKPSVNFGTAVGHGTIRIAAMGFADRKADAKEMHLMKSLLRQSLQEGAFAMTTGLIYPPGCYTDTDELIELSKELPAYGAIYMTHMRDEGAGVVDSVKEAIEICRQ